MTGASTFQKRKPQWSVNIRKGVQPHFNWGYTNQNTARYITHYQICKNQKNLIVGSEYVEHGNSLHFWRGVRWYNPFGKVGYCFKSWMYAYPDLCQIYLSVAPHCRFDNQGCDCKVTRAQKGPWCLIVREQIICSYFGVRSVNLKFQYYFFLCALIY